MKRIYLYIFLFLLSGKKAFPIDYFNSEINYWDKPLKEEKSAEPKKEVKKDKKRTFKWNAYLSPRSSEDLKEVFREGNYTPPAPLLETLNNPSDENIRNWFKFIDLKNSLMRKLQRKIVKLSKKRKYVDRGEESFISRKVGNIKPNNHDVKRFRFRMYFSSSCSHCKRMMGELVKIQNLGFYIELRQVDNNRRYSEGLPFVVNFASPEELRTKNINAWPVLFIADKKLKKIYRINGYQSFEDILFTLQNK